MIRYTTLLLFVALASGMGALGLSVDGVLPGGLASKVENPSAVSGLAVAGSIDASDLVFIAGEMPALRTLDLTDAHIAAYDGDAIDGVRHFAANTLPQMSLAGSPATEIRLPASLEAIGDGALAGAAITQIELPASVRSVGAGAFAGCKSLRTASLGAAALGAGALAGCEALESVSSDAASLPERCFAGCTALTVVDMPSLTSIGDRAFERCTELRSFEFPAALTSIGSRAFAASGLEVADLEGCTGLASVGAGAFAGCGSLRVLVFPEKAIDAGHALAMGSGALETALMPEGELPAYALAGDTKADATAALRRASEAGEYALKGVSEASEVTLPATLEYLGDGAMEGMTGLQHIDASALKSVPELGEDVWKGVRQSEVALKAADDMADAFLAAGQWQDFKISTSGTTSAKDEITGQIRAWFTGKTLIVECRGTDAVKSVRIHDTAGHQLAILTLTPDGRAAADTSRWTENIFIVSALDASDNNLTTIKIARNG